MWKPDQVATRLNRSIPWLYEHLPRLYQLGFPKKDKELGGWDSVAIESWLDKRSNVTSKMTAEKQMLEAIRG